LQGSEPQLTTPETNALRLPLARTLSHPKSNTLPRKKNRRRKKKKKKKVTRMKMMMTTTMSTKEKMQMKKRIDVRH